jgi:hypothetical protein
VPRTDVPFYFGWAQGARRARFSYTNSNRDTEKLATRFTRYTRT